MSTLPEPESAGAVSPHELRQAALALYGWAYCHAHAPTSPYSAEGEPHALRHLLMCPGGPELHEAAVRLLGGAPC